MKRERVQPFIILSGNTEEADLEIVKFLGNVSIKEKIALKDFYWYYFWNHSYCISAIRALRTQI